jgi:hypothetical protein
LPEDVEKICFQAILHSIFQHPNFITKDFDAPKRKPPVALRDYFAAVTVKSIYKTLSETHLQTTKVTDCDLYSVDKIRAAVESVVDGSIVNLLQNFDAYGQTPGAYL